MDIQSKKSNYSHMNKARFNAFVSILMVKDVETSAYYYREKVDLRYERLWGDPPAFCTLDRDGFGWMLSRVDDIKDIKPHYKIVQKMWNVYSCMDDADKAIGAFCLHLHRQLQSY